MERGSNPHERLLSSETFKYSSFCNKSNFHECVQYLDQELSVYGYPSIITHSGLDDVALLNVTRDILVSYKKALESHSEIADSQRNAESELSRLQHLFSLAKEDLANRDREVKAKGLEEAHLHQRIETLQKKLKSDQEKCRRLSAELVSRDVQFKHEKKKKSQEIEKMQTKLHQLLQDKRQDRMLGIEILNSLQRADGRRGRWNTDKTKKNNEQDMYRLIIMNYEDSQKQLLKENNDMRKYLKQMQDELITALNQRIESGKTDESKATISDNDQDTDMCDKNDSANLTDGVFEMPYDLVKDDIERSINTKWKALRKEIHKEREHSIEQGVRSDKLVEYQRVIKEQQQLIDYFTTSHGSKQQEGHAIEDSYFLEEKADLEKQRAQFRQQRLAFEKERKYYTDALLQLGQDRQNFEQEKRVWLQKDFMQITPLRGPRKVRKKKSSSSSGSRGSRRSKGLSSSWSGIAAKNLMDTSECESSDAEESPYESAFGSEHTIDGVYMTRTVDRSPSPEPQPLSISRPNSRRSASPSSPPKSSVRSSSSSSAIPPTPTTSDLYRVLGIRFADKENVEESSPPLARPRADAVIPHSDFFLTPSPPRVRVCDPGAGSGPSSSNGWSHTPRATLQAEFDDLKLD